MEKFYEKFLRGTESEDKPIECEFKSYDPEDGEKINYQFRFGQVTVYKKPSGIFVDRREKNVASNLIMEVAPTSNFARSLKEIEITKNDQEIIKKRCEEIERFCEENPSIDPQEIAKNLQEYEKKELIQRLCEENPTVNPQEVADNWFKYEHESLINRLCKENPTVDRKEIEDNYHKYEDKNLTLIHKTRI